MSVHPPAAPQPADDAAEASQRVVVMGVAGCGKTTVGQLLATHLGGGFVDGDTFHSEANVSKMRSGVALNDADRQPWLQHISAELRQAAQEDRTLVVGCSALKRSYRDLIRGAGLQVTFIHLHGSRELLTERLHTRPGHFMPASLLDSQLATLEMLGPDESGRVLDISAPAGDLALQAHRWVVSGSAHS